MGKAKTLRLQSEVLELKNTKGEADGRTDRHRETSTERGSEGFRRVKTIVATANATLD